MLFRKFAGEYSPDVAALPPADREIVMLRLVAVVVWGRAETAHAKLLARRVQLEQKLNWTTE